jgi:protoporphyrinogen oxidase
MINDTIFDVIVIGGGISGINTALKASESKKVLLIDERKYWGGRIATKTHPKYEMGAARFSNKHKLLNKLICQYKMNMIQLPQTIDHIRHSDVSETEFFADIHKNLDKYFRNLVSVSKKYNATMLKEITLFEFMNLCNDEETSENIVSMFGYHSEIKEMNAYDAINTFKKDFVNVEYFVLEEGLSSLCDRMIKHAKENGCITKGSSFVTSVKKRDDLFEVKTKDCSYFSRTVVFAVKGEQLRQFKILKSIHKHIDSIYSAELLRIYAKYPIRRSGVWFNGLRRMTTNSFLRQIIPIDYDSGLIMVSYTDGKDVNSFKDNKGKILSEAKIKEKVQTELNVLFKTNIPQPLFFKVHYWQVGAHHWKPGYDSDNISKEILNPIKNVFVCGEAFSQKQAWIEGALETSEMILKKIN